MGLRRLRESPASKPTIGGQSNLMLDAKQRVACSNHARDARFAAQIFDTEGATKRNARRTLTFEG